MKFFIIAFIVWPFLIGNLRAQKIISAKSQKIKFVISPDYKRGLPPNLFANLKFRDDNENGILEADESSILSITVENKGAGMAQGVTIKVKDNTKDPALIIGEAKNIPFISPGEKVKTDIIIQATRTIKSGTHKLEITGAEHFKYDMDTAYLVLNTFKFQEPKLSFSGLDILDSGQGTMAIINDGQVQPGEMVRMKLFVQNIGQNVSKNTKFSIQSTSQNIYLTENTGNLGDLKVGEVKEFWITLSPNKRIDAKGKLPVYLTMKNDFACGEINQLQLPIELNQKPPQPDIVRVESDINDLAKEVARFEFVSNKIIANIGNTIDIRQVVPSRTKRSNSVAIIIGIEKYNYFAPAPYAANDAKIVEEYFKNVLGIEQVFLYTNNDVNGFFFENTFNPDFGQLQKAVIKDQTELFVFYSGHGMPSKSGNDVFLFPADGRVEALEVQGYNVNRFFNQLDKIGAKSVTVFIDACFSGLSRTSSSFETKNLVAMKGVRIEPEINYPWETNPNFTLFVSSAFNETSLGFDPSETGLFTYYLCAGLQGKADVDKNKRITTGELADYITQNVRLTSQKIIGVQNPQFYGNRKQIISEY